MQQPSFQLCLCYDIYLYVKGREQLEVTVPDAGGGGVCVEVQSLVLQCSSWNWKKYVSSACLTRGSLETCMSCKYACLGYTQSHYCMASSDIPSWGNNKLTNWRKKDTGLVISCESVWFPFSGELSTLHVSPKRKKEKQRMYWKRLTKKQACLDFRWRF